MSMHATMSLADGVVDPVIASRAKPQISRRRVTDPGDEQGRTIEWRYTVPSQFHRDVPDAARQVVGGPEPSSNAVPTSLDQPRADGWSRAYTIADGIVVKAYCL